MQGTVDIRDRTRIPLWHGMGDTEIVVAEADNDAAARALSAFVNGLAAANRVAIARFVKKENTEARMGYLAPFNAQGGNSGGGGDGYGSMNGNDGSSSSSSSSSSNEGCEGLIFVRLPFKDDDRRWKFQPLGKATAGQKATAVEAKAKSDAASSTGKVNAARAQKLLPTKEQCLAAEDLVAALDLDAAAATGGAAAAGTGGGGGGGGEEEH